MHDACKVYTLRKFSEMGLSSGGLPYTATMWAPFQLQFNNKIIAKRITENMHYHNLYMQTLFNVSANYISHVYCYMHLSHSTFDLLTECAGQAGLEHLSQIQCLKEVVQSHS